MPYTLLLRTKLRPAGTWFIVKAGGRPPCRRSEVSTSDYSVVRRAQIRRVYTSAPGQIKSLPTEADDARFLDESANRNTSGLPGQGLAEMSLDHNLNGRMEKRLPIVAVVRLARAERAGGDGEERTYTDNISARDAEFILFASGSLAMPYTLLLRTKLRPAGTRFIVKGWRTTAMPWG